MSAEFLVRDDFLNPAEADELEKLMFGAFFPWYYLDNTTSGRGSKKWYEIECPMHCHSLFFEGAVNNPGYLQIMQAFGFDPAILVRMKANMVMPHPFELRHTPFHVDRLEAHYTVVYYVNDSNGATLLKCRNAVHKVKPRKGRIVLFDGSVVHAHYLPTHVPRCVINFNFREYPLPGEAPFPASPIPPDSPGIPQGYGAPQRRLLVKWRRMRDGMVMPPQPAIAVPMNTSLLPFRHGPLHA